MEDLFDRGKSLLEQIHVEFLEFGSRERHAEVNALVNRLDLVVGTARKAGRNQMDATKDELRGEVDSEYVRFMVIS